MHDKLTRKDIELMEAELEDRRVNIRPKIIEEVKRTREFGDLSENYEYKAARQAQRKNDSRVRYLENMIKTAEIIDEIPKDTDQVKIYDKVTIYLPDDDETMTVQVVSTVRIQADGGFISMEAPLGKALLGKRVGDTVTVNASEDFSYDVVIKKIESSEDDGSVPLLEY